jgi:nitrogen fixation protein FixH
MLRTLLAFFLSIAFVDVTFAQNLSSTVSGTVTSDDGQPSSLCVCSVDSTRTSAACFNERRRTVLG